MAEIKTKRTKASVPAFIKTIEPEQKQKDAAAILKMFKDITGEKPAMWGTSIIGFGTYQYASERSAQKGEWFYTGFSPRAQGFSLYILEWKGEESPILKKLGKFTRGGGCLYIKRLSDIDVKVLAALIKASFERGKKKAAVR